MNTMGLEVWQDQDQAEVAETDWPCLLGGELVNQQLHDLPGGLLQRKLGLSVECCLVHEG